MPLAVAAHALDDVAVDPFNALPGAVGHCVGIGQVATPVLGEEALPQLGRRLGVSRVGPRPRMGTMGQEGLECGRGPTLIAQSVGTFSIKGSQR